MTRVEIYDQDRKERLMYRTTKIGRPVTLPLTKDGFEALLEVAAKVYDLPVDDRMRAVLAGYIHHIPNETNIITINKIARMLYKSVANSLTWMIDQEIKQKERDRAIAEANKIKDNVVSIAETPEAK